MFQPIVDVVVSHEWLRHASRHARMLHRHALPPPQLSSSRDTLINGSRDSLVDRVTAGGGATIADHDPMDDLPLPPPPPSADYEELHMPSGGGGGGGGDYQQLVVSPSSGDYEQLPGHERCR